MQTRCPQCETRFRVTEKQLEIADGLVRCGICEHVFNVNDQSSENASELEQTIEDNSSQTSSQEEKSSEQYSEELLKNITISEDDEVSTEQLQTDSTVDNNAAIADIQNLSKKDLSNIDSNDEIDGRHQDAYNFFEHDPDDTTEFIVPREFHDSHKSDSPSTISTVLWAIGILLLTVSLFIEYAWFNRNDLVHIPEVQAELDTICQQIDCSKIPLRAPSKIQLISRNIYSHPNEKDALMVNVTIKNNAAFSQPYPMMKIDFTDIRGNIIASRKFLPQEYLYAQNQRYDENLPLLLPESSSDITIEVLDPGTEAITYEFNFL